MCLYRRGIPDIVRISSAFEVYFVCLHFCCGTFSVHPVGRTVGLQHASQQDPVPPALLEALHAHTGQTVPVLVLLPHLIWNEVL